MITGEKAANAVGGKTARACDNCVRKRARWYCAADDAFLCQACDSSVHSANLLASRHERVRLEKVTNPKLAGSISVEPAWHKGVTKKARTPRPAKPMVKLLKDDERGNLLDHLDLVPEIDNDESSPHEDEDQLLYRVPILDPFMYDVPNDMENHFSTSLYDESCELDTIQAFDLPSDMDLAEFAADVESLLGGGIDHKDPCGVHGLGFLDCIEEEENIAIFNDYITEGRKFVKVEDDTRMSEFDDEVREEEKPVMAGDCMDEDGKRKISLRLDYDGVINAWDSKGCPWTNGTRPDINPYDCWPDITGSHLEGSFQQWIGGQMRRDDVGREARVTRYREKRRTRLFSKKIRYQVRKLNADKRPRMKGRFVKRSSLSSSSSFAPPPTFPSYHHL